MREGPFVLEVCRGPLAGTKAVLRRGKVVQVGRTDRSDLSVPADKLLAGVHFAVDWQGARPRLVHLAGAVAPGGTKLNGAQVDEAPVKHGDWIKAGATDLMVHDLAMARRSDEPMLPVRARALETLDDEHDPLFGVFDGTRSDRVRALLGSAEERYRSLYDGPQADALADAAPYLVELPRVSAVLELLVREGWGRRWGVYLTSDLPFDEVRRHLRRFLMVDDEESAERLYFRFYDPAVLRVFLPTCSPRQAASFFGSIGRFYVEGEEDEVLLFPKPAPPVADAQPGGE